MFDIKKIISDVMTEIKKLASVSILDGNKKQIGTLRLDLKNLSVMAMKYGKLQQDKLGVYLPKEAISFVGTESKLSFVALKPYSLILSYKNKKPKCIAAMMMDDMVSELFADPFRAESHTQHTNFPCRTFGKAWEPSHKLAILAYHEGRQEKEDVIARVVGHYITCLVGVFKIKGIVPHDTVADIESFVIEAGLQAYPEYVLIHNHDVRFCVGGRHNLSINLQKGEDGKYRRTIGNKENQIKTKHVFVQNLIFN